MAFRFNLESILKHRKRLEEVAHREFIEARAILDQCLKGIEAMYGKIDQTRVLVSEAEKAGETRNAGWVVSLDSFIEGQKIRIEKERLRARELILNVELKEEELVKRLNDRKAMDKLKERRFEEYKEQLERLERSEMDDLTSVRAGRSK
jgi:flagellar FliJ protein